MNMKYEFYYLSLPAGFGLRSLRRIYENACLNMVSKIVKGKTGTKLMMESFKRWWLRLNGNPVIDGGVRAVNPYLDTAR